MLLPVLSLNLHVIIKCLKSYFPVIVVKIGSVLVEDIINILSLFLQCGFFYRRALHELKLRIEIQKLSSIHLVSAQRNSSLDTDNETFVLTPFPSGSDDTQVMTPPPGYLEATQRTSNSSTDYFFNFDDEDGYLIPVFDSSKNDSPDRLLLDD